MNIILKASLREIVIISLLAVLNICILASLNPLTLGVMVIVQSLLIALLTAVFLPTFWFSYLLILVYLGGLLVLFIYVASLASNEQINSSFIPIYTGGLISLFLVYSFPELLKLEETSNDNFPSETIYTWIFSPSTLIIAGALIVYLFIALVAVVKITKWWGGSIRPTSSY